MPHDRKKRRVPECCEVEWLMEYIPRTFVKYSFLGAGPLFKTIQRIKEKAQVTLYPSREVREVPG